MCSAVTTGYSGRATSSCLHVSKAVTHFQEVTCLQGLQLPHTDSLSAHRTVWRCVCVCGGGGAGVGKGGNAIANVWKGLDCVWEPTNSVV